MSNLKIDLAGMFNRQKYAEPPERYLREWQDFLLDRLNEWGYQLGEDTKSGITQVIDCFAARRVHEKSVITNQVRLGTTIPIYRPPKGVLLCGGVGTGKTMLLKILAEPSPPEYTDDHKICFRRYPGALYQSITDIIGSLLRDGREFAEKFCKRHTKDILILDDLGQEGDMQYYGTKISKFVELIIERRYQLFEQTGAMTVFATNLQPSSPDGADLEHFYDARTVSRLAAMTEIVPFNGSDWRKRA